MCAFNRSTPSRPIVFHLILIRHFGIERRPGYAPIPLQIIVGKVLCRRHHLASRSIKPRRRAYTEQSQLARNGVDQRDLAQEDVAHQPRRHLYLEISCIGALLHPTRPVHDILARQEGILAWCLLPPTPAWIPEQIDIRRPEEQTGQALIVECSSLCRDGSAHGTPERGIESGPQGECVWKACGASRVVVNNSATATPSQGGGGGE